jgi:hypothetical protein
MLRKKVFAILILVCLAHTSKLYAQNSNPVIGDYTSDTTIVTEDDNYADDDEDYSNADTVEPEKVNAYKEKYFSDTLQVKHFDKKEWEKLTKGVIYRDEEEKPQKEKEPKEITINSMVIIGLLIGIVAIILGFVLYAIFKGIGNRTNNDSTLPGTDIDINEEELPQRDVLRKLLNEAIANGNYKLATRYYYLLMILQYKQQGLIKWKKDKTNSQYLRELRNNNKYTDIKMATNLFERYWYGDVEPDKVLFAHVETVFGRILNPNAK